MAHILAIDLGTGGPKVALVHHTGTVVATETEHNSISYLPGGGAEQDPDEWWTSIMRAAKRLIAIGSVPANDIVAVAVAAQWMSTVPVGADGTHLCPALSWLDSRGETEARRLAGGPINVMGYDPRKLAKWIRYTGGAPSLTGKDPVGHIAWLKAERPEIYAATKVFLEPTDYINLRFTGRAVASTDSVAGHWVTDNRDLGAVDYRDDLIALAGVDRAKLPDLVPTGTIIGTVLPEVARSLGLNDGTTGPAVKVVTAMGDTHAAAIGSGAVADLAAHLYVGTSSWVSCHVPFKKTDILHTIGSMPSGIPGRYLALCAQESAGSALTFIINNILFPADGLGIEMPDNPHQQLNDLAARVPAGANGLMFTPWLNGERTPVEDTTIRGGFHNLSASSTRADMVRSVFEGVAHNTRWMHGHVEKFAGTRFDEINFTGGGALSPVWGQIFADVLDRTIHRTVDPRSAGVRGCALAASVALGLITWADAETGVTVEQTHKPNPTNRASYDSAHATFRRLYTKNRATYRKWNNVDNSGPASGP